MPSLSKALALSVIAAGAANVAPDAGDVSDTDGDAFGGGGEPAAVTDTLSKRRRGEGAGVMTVDGEAGVDGRRHRDAVAANERPVDAVCRSVGLMVLWLRVSRTQTGGAPSPPAVWVDRPDVAVRR